jgi:chaperonin cofactor prefoldin
LVLEEFDFLNGTDVVLKQGGPTLIKEDLSEAKTNVIDRVAFIQRQLTEVESSIVEAQQRVADAETQLQLVQLPAQ